MLGHQLDRVIQVLGLEDQDATQLLLGLRVGTVGNHHLSAVKPQGGSVLRRLKRLPARKVSVLAKDVVVTEARVHESVQLALGHRLPLFWVHVAKADVFHGTASPPMLFVNDFSSYGRSGEGEIDMGPRKMCFPPCPSGFITSGAARLQRAVAPAPRSASSTPGYSSRRHRRARRLRAHRSCP